MILQLVLNLAFPEAAEAAEEVGTAKVAVVRL